MLFLTFAFFAGSTLYQTDFMMHLFWDTNIANLPRQFDKNRCSHTLFITIYNIEIDEFNDRNQLSSGILC